LYPEVPVDRVASTRSPLGGSLDLRARALSPSADPRSGSPLSSALVCAPRHSTFDSTDTLAHRSRSSVSTYPVSTPTDRGSPVLRVSSQLALVSTRPYSLTSASPPTRSPSVRLARTADSLLGYSASSTDTPRSGDLVSPLIVSLGSEGSSSVIVRPPSGSLLVPVTHSSLPIPTRPPRSLVCVCVASRLVLAPRPRS
jgi:hypothetical protein